MEQCSVCGSGEALQWCLGMMPAIGLSVASVLLNLRFSNRHRFVDVVKGSTVNVLPDPDG